MAKRCKNGRVKSGARKGQCRKVKTHKCRAWALVHKPSLGRAVRTCVNRGGKRPRRGGPKGDAIYGPLRSSGLFGLGDFLGFL